MMMTGRRVGVLWGGVSGPQAQAMRAAQAVVSALHEGGQEAVLVAVDRTVDQTLRQLEVELAFLAVRGRLGADGCVQGLLELLGIPYTGSGLLASAVAMNRARLHDLLRLRNVPTAVSYVLRGESAHQVVGAHGGFGFPVLVRGLTSGPEGGGAVARSPRELARAAEAGFAADDELLVERFVEGRLVRVALLDGVPLGSIDRGESSWLVGGRPRGSVEAAARVSLGETRQRALLRVAAQVVEALGAEGAATVDLVVSERWNEVVIDVDLAPLLTPSSTFARIAAAAGQTFPSIIDGILRGARLRAHALKDDRRSLETRFQGGERRVGSSQLPH